MTALVAPKRSAVALVVAVLATLLVSTPAQAANGAFQGTVTAQTGGAAIANASVVAYDATGSFAGSTTANSSGFYTLAGLAPGQYRVVFTAPVGQNFLSEWYNDQTSLATATPITVTSGGLLGSVNAALTTGAIISGTLTTGATTPVSNGTVVLYDSAQNYVASTASNGSGVYTFSRVRAGLYTLWFPAPTGFATEWWENKISFRTATLFSVATADSVTKSNNFAAEGAITGTVTRAGGDPLSAAVVAYEAGGTTDSAASWVAQTYSDPGTGAYVLGGLPAGDYKVGFTTYASGTTPTGALAADPLGYAPEWSSHAFSYSAATVVNVFAPTHTTGGVSMTLYNPSFADVSQHTSSVYESVEWVYARGISTGTAQPGGKPLYKPTDAVSRQAMASFLFKMSGLSFTAPTTPTFADVTQASPFYTAVEWMASRGISLGTPQPSGKPLFKPADPVSRQSMALFLARYAGAVLTSPGYQDFADVPTSSDAYTAIHFMWTAGISTGTAQPDSLPLYKPLDPVSRQSMAVFLKRLDAYLGTTG